MNTKKMLYKLSWMGSITASVITAIIAISVFMLWLVGLGVWIFLDVTYNYLTGNKISNYCDDECYESNYGEDIYHG